MTEVNKLENRKTIEKINKTRTQFFEKINHITNIYLDQPRKKKREGLT